MDFQEVRRISWLTIAEALGLSEQEDSTLLIQAKSYTAAALPSAATYPRGVVYVSDEGVLAYSNGSTWERVVMTGSSPTFDKVTIVAADGTIPFLVSGTTKGVRARTTASGAVLEGVDSTGSASYQPLLVGGSTLSWLISGNAKGGVDASGNLSCVGLLDLSGASAGQIKFPATQNSSSDANTLDDYDENTWTPTDGSGAGLSFTAAIGSYTKIGRIVIAQCTVIYPATADGSNALIGGLPFTVGSSNAAGATYTTCATATTVLAYATTTLVGLVAAAGAAAITNAQMTGKTIAFTLIYEV